MLVQKLCSTTSLKALSMLLTATARTWHSLLLVERQLYSATMLEPGSHTTLTHLVVSSLWQQQGTLDVVLSAICAVT